MMFKSLTFGDINSKDLDMYISGSSAYDAPPRAFEMIDVPGRNGQLSIDGGRYENIEVTYPAGVFAESEEAFRAKMANIRAAFLSQVGYQRLTDEYNPDEYRLGIFSGGIEADPVARLKASEFDITFNCKPQRFLTSGEETVNIGEYTDPVGEDNAPYLFRRSPQFADTYDTCIPTIVGGSVVGNQLVESTGSGLSVTVPSGHKYYSVISGTKTIGTSTGTAITGLSGGVDMVTDLTAMLGTSIADRAYAMEQAQAGSGIAWLKSYGFISDSYEEYDTGTMKSVEATAHKTVGKNLANIADISAPSTSNTETSVSLPNGNYTLSFDVVSAVRTNLSNTSLLNIVDADGGNHYFTGATVKKVSDNSDFNSAGANINGRYYCTYSGSISKIIFYWRSNSYATFTSGAVQNIQLEFGSTATEYEPYTSHSYPLGNVTLRGVPKVDANDNIYYDGDLYHADGTVDRRFGYRAYQSGDESLADAITDGTNTVYKLNTQTTETSDPFTSPMLCDPNGTEEWVTDNGVPVGSVTEYGPDPTKLHNPTLFASKPLIKVTGTGTLGVGSYSMTITGTASQQLYIDCDLMEAWEDVGGARVQRNDRITYAGNKFPELDPGETGITTDGITAVEIVPRWWTL